MTELLETQVYSIMVVTAPRAAPAHSIDNKQNHDFLTACNGAKRLAVLRADCGDPVCTCVCEHLSQLRLSAGHRRHVAGQRVVSATATAGIRGLQPLKEAVSGLLGSDVKLIQTQSGWEHLQE